MQQVNRLKSIGFIILLIFCVVAAAQGHVYGEETPASWPQPENEPYGRAAILMESDTGAILYAKNIDEKLYPASITKIMTGLLAVENLSLNDTITFTGEMLNSLPPDAAIQGVQPGETMTVRDCLYSLLLRSNNDIAVAFAYKIAGSEEAFGKMMTERAKEIGAVNTNFVNASGLHDENHYTTARDMALITLEAISNPTFASIWGTSEYDLSATDRTEGYTIWHRHNMLVSGRADYYPYAIGGKTGYTDEAGRTLVTCAEKDGMRLVSVLMFSDNAYVFSDTIDLFTYGFNNFNKVTIRDHEERFGQSGGSGFSIVDRLYGNEVSLLTIGEGSVVIPKTASLKEIEYSLNMNVEDMGKGEVAEITYTHGGYGLGRATVYMTDVYNRDVSGISSLEKTEETVKKADVKEIFSINILYIVGAVITVMILLFLIRLWIRAAKKRKIGKKYYIKR